MNFQRIAFPGLGLLLGVAPSIQTFAQSDSTNGLMLRIGQSGGINIASIDGYREDSRLGLVVGGAVEFTFSNLCIQAEPRYIQKGLKETYVLTSSTGPTIIGTARATLKLDYVDMPVLLKWYLTETVFRPFVVVGGSVGVLMSARREFEDGAVLQTGEPLITDLKDSYESFDITLDAGIGFEYRLSSSLSLLAGGRYSHGVHDLWGPATSRGIQVLMGALFDP